MLYLLFLNFSRIWDYKVVVVFEKQCKIYAQGYNKTSIAGQLVLSDPLFYSKPVDWRAFCASDS